MSSFRIDLFIVLFTLVLDVVFIFIPVIFFDYLNPIPYEALKNDFKSLYYFICNMKNNVHYGMYQNLAYLGLLLLKLFFEFIVLFFVFLLAFMNLYSIARLSIYTFECVKEFVNLMMN